MKSTPSFWVTVIRGESFEIALMRSIRFSLLYRASIFHFPVCCNPPIGLALIIPDRLVLLRKKVENPSLRSSLVSPVLYISLCFSHSVIVTGVLLMSFMRSLGCEVAARQKAAIPGLMSLIYI